MITWLFSSSLTLITPIRRPGCEEPVHNCQKNVQVYRFCEVFVAAALTNSLLVAAHSACRRRHDGDQPYFIFRFDPSNKLCAQHLRQLNVH